VLCSMVAVKPAGDSSGLASVAAANGQPVNLAVSVPAVQFAAVALSVVRAGRCPGPLVAGVLGGLAVLLFGRFATGSVVAGAVIASLCGPSRRWPSSRRELGWAMACCPPGAGCAGRSGLGPAARADPESKMPRLERMPYQTARAWAAFRAVALGLLLASGPGAPPRCSLAWPCPGMALIPHPPLGCGEGPLEALLLAGGLAFVPAQPSSSQPRRAWQARWSLRAWLRNIRPGAGEYRAWGIPGRPAAERYARRRFRGCRRDFSTGDGATGSVCLQGLARSSPSWFP